jgi:hypothetical protein
MKKTAIIIAMLVAMPWFLALAAKTPGGAENSISSAQNRQPLLASQVEPPVPTVITGTGLPPEAHLSREIQGRSDIIHPVQNQTNLPKQLPLNVARSTAANRPLETKSEDSGAPIPPDPNVILQGGDTFTSATLITSLPYYDTGTTIGYTNDYEGNCGGVGAPDVVYRFNPPIDTLLNISLCDATDYDSKVYVCVNANPLDIIACNDDNCGLASALAEVHVTAGNSYYIVVDGFSTNSGNYSLSVSLAAFVPDPCDYGGSSIFSNRRTDGADGISDFQSTDGTYDRWGVDDMTVYDHAFVTGINWLCLSSVGFDWNSTADVMLLLDNGGTPGSVYYSFPDMPCTRTSTGRNLFGIDEFVYSVSGLSAYLTAGTYWIAARPNSSTLYNNFWVSAPVQGNPCYISLPDLGYPMWSPGSAAFVIDRDLSFCVMGNFGAQLCSNTSSLWHNGDTNYLQGWYNFRTTDGANDFSIVNDVSFINPVLIHAFNWVTVDNSLDWNGTADYIILADAAGAPGAVISEIHDVPCSRLATGNFPYNFPEYIYTISGLNIYLPAGAFWVGMRPVGASTGSSFWMISANFGQESYVDYSAFGYPRWTPSTTAMGGSYDFSFCIEGEFAPPPDPCTDGTLIYSSGFPDMINGLNVGRSTDGVMNMTVVADVELAQDAVLNDFHWFILEIDNDWNGDADLLILSDNTGTPGSVVYSQNNIPATRIPTGRVLFGIPEYTFGITGAGISLPAGIYWIGLRPVSNTPTSFYWETAPLIGNPVFVDYPDYGYPAWTPSNLPFGVNYDASFCINGELTGGCSFVVGDVNNNGAFNGIDVSFSVGYFKGGPVPPYTCDCNSSTWFVAGDVNGNCAFNGIDVSYMVAYFKGGPAPIPCPACAPTVLGAAPIVIPSSKLIANTKMETTLAR